jgi:hypothetical protein
VQPDDALRRRHARRHRRDEQGGRVGGEDRIRSDHLGHRGEQRALDLEHLGRGLDHHVAAGEPGQVGRPLHALDANRGRGIWVVQDHGQPRIARRGGDPGAHGSCSSDPEHGRVPYGP